MQKKSNKLSFALVLIVIVISTMFSIYSISHIGKENEKDMNLLLTASIHDAIDNSLSKPIMAAKTMSYTEPLIRFLDKEESLGNAEADIELMKAYLTDLKKGLKYDSVFVVSEGTRRYYTDHGLNKIVDPENDAHDIWYSFFLDKNKYYDLDVDTDEVNYNTWT
ncbi:MAG: hypothetical protein Q4B60_03115, partial [Erysipelotrichaceae bacterium]|nr:hypothetical protein [Erysipelotrichaceae bacterium]